MSLFRKSITGLVLTLSTLSGVFQATSPVHAAVSLENMSAYVVLPLTADALEQATSMHYDILIDAKGVAQTAHTTGLSLQGDMEQVRTDPNGVTVSLDGHALYDGSLYAQVPAFSMLVNANRFYFKINSETGYDPLSGYNNKWIMIDEAMMQQMMASMQGADSMNPGLPELLAQREAMMTEQTEMLREMITRQAIAFNYIYAGENMDGVETYRLPYIVDFNVLATVIEEHATGDQAQAFLEAAQSFREMDREHVKIYGELFVGKEDFLPRRFTTRVSMQDAQTRHDQELGSFQANLSRFNLPISWNIPTDAIPFTQVMQEIQAQQQQMVDEYSYDDEYVAPEQVRDQFDEPTEPMNNPSDMDWDEDGLTNEQEAYYGTNPRHFDTDGDGYVDGMEVENGYNPNGSGNLVDTHHS